MSREINVRVRLPTLVTIPLAPLGSFYDSQGRLTQTMADWLVELAEAMSVFEQARHMSGPHAGDSILFVYIRCENLPDGKTALLGAGRYDPNEEGDNETLMDELTPDPPHDPIICKVQVADGWPDERVYFLLSDFQGDGSRAKAKLFDLIQLLG